MSLFITSPKEVNWFVQPQDLANQLHLYREGANITWHQGTEDERLFTWKFSSEKGEWVEVSLTRSLRSIYIDGFAELCAEFVYWFKQNYSENQQLLFFDEGMNFCVLLQELSSEQIYAKIVGER